MFLPTRTVAPATTPVTLAEMKAHLRVDFTDDDDLIQSLLDAAVQYLDGYAGILGRCLITQTWKQTYPSFDRCLRLPFPNVTGVTLKYFDSSNVEQTVSAANYQLLEDSEGAYIELILPYVPPYPYIFRIDPVNVTLVAGFADAASVPVPIKQAIKLLGGDWYDSRATMQEGRLAQLPFSVEALLAPFKRKSF
jgi:uncharacterized phiE125 gp8 family phage protein